MSRSQPPGSCSIRGHNRRGGVPLEEIDLTSQIISSCFLCSWVSVRKLMKVRGVDARCVTDPNTQ